MKTLKVMSLLLVMIMVGTAFVGCAGTAANDEQASTQAGKEETSEPEQNKLEGTIEIAGSTSVQPLAQNLAEVFMNIHPGVQVNVQGIGSSKGINAANDGTANIGTSSRNLTTEEEGWGLTKHVIALDGIAVAVHPSNPVSDLTQEQIKKIFKGEIKNWKEVGGADKAIIVVSREAGSGTRGAFEEILGLEAKIDGKKVSAVTEEALIADSNGAVKKNIESKEDAIGYLSLGYIDEKVKTLKVDGVEATIENIQSEKYSVSRPFLMLTKGETSALVKAYIDFIMSDEGQKVVAEDFISVK